MVFEVGIGKYLIYSYFLCMTINSIPKVFACHRCHPSAAAVIDYVSQNMVVPSVVICITSIAHEQKISASVMEQSQSPGPKNE